MMPCIKVGNFILTHPENGKLWIRDVRSGEGGQFDVIQVEEALDILWAKYY